MLKKLFALFLTFAKIGSITFGGGLTMLPLLTREIVQKKKWATEEELLDYYAVGQCTPGVIAVNTSTFIGYKQKGILGGISATLGVIFPSVVIIVLISKILNKFKESKLVQDIFYGLRPASTGLIIAAGLGVAKVALLHLNNFIDTKNIFNLFIITLSID